MPAQETSLYIAIVLAAVLLLGYLIFVMLIAIRYQRRHRALNMAKIGVGINILERERMRIVEHLHDDIGPVLSIVKLQLSAMSGLDNTDAGLIADAAKHVDYIVTHIRSLNEELLPGTLLRHGLLAALGELIQRINATQKLHIILITEQIKVNLSKAMELAVFRILQEIIHNTVKHAAAQQLQIKLATDQAFFYVHTKDDGKGFVTDSQTGKGWGISHITSRIHYLGGEIVLKSKPGAGVVYIITIPLIYA